GVNNGTLTIHGKASGEETEQPGQIGIVQALQGDKSAGFRASVAPGSKLDLNVDDVQAAIALGLAPPSGSTRDVGAGFAGAKIDGALGGDLNLGDASYQGNGTDVKTNGSADVKGNAPFSATISPDGTLAFDPQKTSATLPLNMTLNAGTTVDYKGK